MKVKDIYNLAVKSGLDADLRGRDYVEKKMLRKRDRYEKLSSQEKEMFDKDSLENPYPDSVILNIAEDKEIKKVMVGIDIGPAEVLLAKEIGGVDLVISHHPQGKGLASLADVMDLQCEVLSLYGVPINVAEGLMH